MMTVWRIGIAMSIAVRSILTAQISPNILPWVAARALMIDVLDSGSFSE